MLVRSHVYQVDPIDSVESWFVRDTWMSVPRLAAFLAIFCIHGGWRRPRLDFWRAGDFKVVALGLVVVALWWFYFSGGVGDGFSTDMICIGVATSAVVGLFEEYAFRGPLLVALGPARQAVLLSSFLFAIYHFQAQSVEAWPAIFGTGVVFASLRFRGASLALLVALHTLIDAGYFFFASGTPAMTSAHGLALTLGALGLGAAVFPYRRRPA
ncbi:MAG TPA: CPBP family intramembrane glutamic endopeptidase [Verrucomicrobiae bacterium]|jgi:hypothetical protein|nr:CPBP family intramembrane glutamic endopeptidase [Verrucomicrobiae bacterium]